MRSLLLLLFTTFSSDEWLRCDRFGLFLSELFIFVRIGSWVKREREKEIKCKSQEQIVIYNNRQKRGVKVFLLVGNQPPRSLFLLGVIPIDAIILN